MANKVISAILNLKDNMSGGLVKAAKNTKNVSKEMVSATREVVRFKNKAVSSVTSAAKSFAKLGVAVGTATAALAAKTGFAEALDLEGYKLQLETATKDTQKASQIMQYAMNLANKTPFEGGELVEAAAKFESMGMAAETWLLRAGDMAAATNKRFDQAAEALIDAQNGELERLKEFGITKAKILEQGEKMFAGVQLVNNKGQITNQEKFNEAMIALMEDRFAGGMEKQATTMKGLWSTVTGVTKSALAGMVGMSTDGSIRAGSALDLLKGKVSLLAERFQQWQQDGTLDRLAQKFDQGLGKAVDYAGKAFQWVTENGDTIKRWMVGLGSALAMVKTAQFASGVLEAVKTFRLFASTVGAFVAANPIVIGIGAAILAGTMLIANWDKVKEKVGEVWQRLKEFGAGVAEGAGHVFGPIVDGVVGAFRFIRDEVGGFFSWIGELLSGLDKKIENTPLIGSVYKGIKGAGSWVAEQLAITDNGGVPGRSAAPLSGHATGTSFFAGGLTRVNERGGEILNLPGGTQIIPHDLSRRMMGGTTVKVYVTVQGNVIGNEAYADSLGNLIVQRILRALDNV